MKLFKEKEEIKECSFHPLIHHNELQTKKIIIYLNINSTEFFLIF